MRNRSSQSGGRSPLSGGFWTPDRSETSQSSGSSAAERNPLLAAAARAFGSCFRPMDSRSSMNELSEEFKPYTTTESSSASSHGSLKNRSAKGIYRTGNSSARSESGVMKFTVSDIHRATKNFSPSLKIGQGGFGAVYKGTLDDGYLVAVKRAKKSIYDSNVDVEFQSEVRTLSQIEHLNLVRFLGYLEYDDEKIVVIEYVPKGTLREHLDGLHGNQLDLGARLDIAIDVAHAITYLHMYAEHPIIHRDIKSSNILLTENLRAKVADFGFARLGATETGISHVSTQVKGTAGYLDPEYLRTYQLTEKSDVYSFGVLLVELMSGRRPIEPKRELKERITIKWAIRKFSDGEAIQVLDPNLRRNPATNLALEKTMELSLQCLAPTRLSRPSMKRCAEILWSIRKDYRELLLSSDPPSNQRKPSFTEEREFIKPLN